jgi:DNA anti-recombination protein RmuC
MNNTLPSVPMIHTPHVHLQGFNAFLDKYVRPSLQRINMFLDKYVLPYPVKYLTNRVTILVTLALLIPLIALKDETAFVLVLNSYLNVMSVVVSSTVLLYSTLAEARDRIAAQRREDIAQMQEAMVEQRAQTDHELIQEIHKHLDEIRIEVMTHVNTSLDNIQNILIERLEKAQAEDHRHIEETHKAVMAGVQSHLEELAALRELVENLHRSLGGLSPASNK